MMLLRLMLVVVSLVQSSDGDQGEDLTEES